MLSIDYLIELVSKTAEGKDNFEKGAVGFNGYGFVFRDFDQESNNSSIINAGSSKLCSFGAFEKVYKRFTQGQDSILSIEELLNYDSQLDLYIGSKLKSLIPNLKFGGNELLFDVWIFVKTPKNQVFPVTLYYGQSGTSIGGWTSDYYVFTEGKVFPQDFGEIINYSPFDFSNNELEDFIEALRASLDKIPVSDFEGIYTHDLGEYSMGIKLGRPFVRKVSLQDKKKETWSYAIIGSDDAFQLYFKYGDIIRESLPLAIYKKYPDGLPNEIYRSQIEKNYKQLIKFANTQNSRLAYIVLGVVLMAHGGKMTTYIKKIILRYSDWEYERDQLESEQDIIERSRHLKEYQYNIKNYDGIEPVKTPLFTVTRIINEKRAKGEDPVCIMKKDIDYSIKRS